MAVVLDFPVTHQRSPSLTPRQIAQDADYRRYARQQIRTAILGVLVCAIIAVFCAALAYFFLIVAYLANSLVFMTLGTAAALLGGYFAHWGKVEYDEYRTQRSCYRDRRISAASAPAWPHRRFN